MARKGKVKVREHEKLDDVTLCHVIELLSRKDPITKKEACEILNISYNTSRLNKILEDFKDKQEYAKRRIKENKGKPYSEYDKKLVIMEYLRGASVASIAKLMFRSSSSIKTLLKNSKVPVREDLGELIPDENLNEVHSVDDLVWSARYNCVAEIMGLHSNNPTHGNVYSVWIFGKHNQRGYQPWYELGTLPIVKELGINGNDVKVTDQLNLEYR